MQKRTLRELIAFTLIIYSTGSFAIDPLDSYIGIQAGTADYEGLDLNYGVIRVGIEFNDNVALEFRTGRGVDEEDDQGVEFEVERIGGIYGLYHLNMGSGSVYAIGGWSDGTIKASGNAQSIQQDDNSLSYGAGLQYRGINIEWIQYIDTSEIEFDAVSVGYNYHFD